MIEFIRSENFISGFYLALFLIGTFNFIALKYSGMKNKMNRLATISLTITLAMTFFGVFMLGNFTEDGGHLVYVILTLNAAWFASWAFGRMEDERLNSKGNRGEIHHVED